MKLYAIHDDPSHNTDIFERWWCLVWAKNDSEALDIAAVNYSGDGPEPFRNLLEANALDQEKQDRLSAFTPENPCVERRIYVMRLAGFHEEGEPACDTCGLASLWLEEFTVCDECGQCLECGCCDGCQNKQAAALLGGE